MRVCVYERESEPAWYFRLPVRMMNLSVRERRSVRRGERKGIRKCREGGNAKGRAPSSRNTSMSIKTRPIGSHRVRNLLSRIVSQLKLEEEWKRRRGQDEKEKSAEEIDKMGSSRGPASRAILKILRCYCTSSYSIVLLSRKMVIEGERRMKGELEILPKFDRETK